MSSRSKVIPYSKILPDEYTKLGKQLAGGHLPSIAKAVVGHKQLYEVFKLILDKVDDECNQLCRRQPSSPSLFRRAPLTQFMEWDWKLAIDELANKAPTLLHVLTTIASRSDHRNSKKSGNAHYPGIIMSVAVILKERNREMVGIQSLISLLLFNSRVEKQVCQISYVQYLCTTNVNIFCNRFTIA